MRGLEAPRTSKWTHALLAALCVPALAAAADEQTATVYAADPLTGQCTNRPLYYVRGEFVFAVDAATGRPTEKVIRFIMADRIVAAETYLGQRGGTVLRYMEGNRVYAADARGERTGKIVSYIVGNKVYAADDVTGAQTRIAVRCIIGTARTD